MNTSVDWLGHYGVGGAQGRNVTLSLVPVLDTCECEPWLLHGLSPSPLSPLTSLIVLTTLLLAFLQLTVNRWSLITKEGKITIHDTQWRIHRRKSSTCKNICKSLPGPPTLPIIGNLHQLASRPKHAHLTLDHLAEKYGNIYSLQLGSVKAVVLSDYDVIKTAFYRFTDRPAWYLVQLVTAGCKGLVWQSGRPWKELRRFTHVGLRDFGVGDRTLEERVVLEASSMVDAFSTDQGTEVDPMLLLQKATSNITCAVCFGDRFDYEDNRFCHLLDMIRNIFAEFSVNEPINFFPFMEWLPHTPRVRRSMRYLAAIDKLIDDQIADHRMTFDPDQPRDFVDLYVREELSRFGDDVFSDVNMRLIIRDLFIAGSETTATTLSWLLLYMVSYPDVQAKCQQQIDQVLGRTEMPTMASKQQLTYIEATIFEVMRLSSVMPMMLHQSANVNEEVHGHMIPADTAILANVYSVHRSHDHWDQPDLFTPERFLDERGDVIRNKQGFIPFGIGPRRCPAEALARMEIFIFFTTLLQRFTFKMASDGEPPSLQGVLGVTLAPEHFRVCCLPREVTADC